jgi:hypothetical protein
MGENKVCTIVQCTCILYMLDDVSILKGPCPAKRLKIISETEKSGTKKNLPYFFAYYRYRNTIIVVLLTIFFINNVWNNFSF